MILHAYLSSEELFGKSGRNIDDLTSYSLLSLAALKLRLSLSLTDYTISLVTGISDDPFTSELSVIGRIFYNCIRL